MSQSERWWSMISFMTGYMTARQTILKDIPIFERYPNHISAFSPKEASCTLGPPSSQEASLWRVAGPCAPERHWWTRGSPCAALGKVEGHRTDQTANTFRFFYIEKLWHSQTSVLGWFWVTGLSFQDLDTKFWRRRRVQHSDSDVILRSISCTNL